MQDLVERMEEEEAAEREQRELERSTCRIKLFCQLPGHPTMLERKLRVHKDATLKETTQLAHKVSILSVHFSVTFLVHIHCRKSPLKGTVGKSRTITISVHYLARLYYTGIYLCFTGVRSGRISASGEMPTGEV